MNQCGGCQGLGSHQKLCPRHPNYHPWRRLALMATEIGDMIGSNDTGVANAAYHLAAEVHALIVEHPWRGRICDCDSMSGRFGAHRPECPTALAQAADAQAGVDHD